MRAAILLLIVGCAVAGEGFVGGVQIVLHGAIASNAKDDVRNLVVDVEAEPGGRWRRVWGYALSWRSGDHHGYVAGHTWDGRTLTLDLLMAITGDNYMPGQDIARYRITLARSVDGAGALGGEDWEGTFTGAMGSAAVQGRASGRTHPPRPVVPGFTPVAPGEHPRLLFRKADLPRLRERLQTPLGQAAKVAFAGAGKDMGQNAALGLAILYQLTGDASYAQRAQPAFVKALEDQSFGDFNTGQIWAHRLLNVAATWDCCMDAWPEALNRKVHDTLLKRIEMLYWNRGGNANPTSNWAGPMNSAAALASLVFLNDPGEGPPAPGTVQGKESRNGYRTHPLYEALYRAGNDKVVDLPALDGIKPEQAAGPFAPGQPLTGWVWSGILAVELPRKQDPLQSLGGCARALPAAGTKAESTIFSAAGPIELAFAFKPLPGDAVDPAEGIDGDRLLAVDGARTAILSTLLRVDAPRTVGIRPGKATRVFIDDREAHADAVYRLAAGVHRVLVVASATGAIGRLDPVITDAGAAGGGAAEALALFGRLERADWEAGGKPDFEKQFLVETGQHRAYLYGWLGMGSGGFQAESGHYSHDGGPGPIAYAGLHRRLFGRDLSPWSDFTHYIPRHIAASALGGGRRGLHGLPIDGINAIDLSFMARLFPILPDQLKPGALWAWNRLAGVTGAADIGKALANDAVFAFLNYPLDLAPAAPAPPAWPLVWPAPTRGYVAFRNAYRDADDLIVQVFAKALPIHGWNHPNAGCFTVQGFGLPWAVAVEERLGYRLDESVVLLPDDDTAQGACGRLTHLRSDADGSGAVSIDLDEVYAGKGARGRDHQGIRLPADRSRQAIRGARAFAVDYSGKAGAPLLLAIADRIDGGGARRWQWQLPPDAAAAAQFGERSFSVTRGGATLTVTIVHPAAPRFEKPGAGKVTVVAGGHDKVKAGETYDRPLNGVGVAGSDHFLIVATLGKGAAPAVQVAGSGLAAVATVGGRQVRFADDILTIADR